MDEHTLTARDHNPSLASLRVVIVARHASARFGGEAILPLHYFMFLRARGVSAWLVVHEWTREELQQLCRDDLDRIHFVSDHRINRVLRRIGRPIPAGMPRVMWDTLSHFITQLAQRRVVRRLVREHDVSVVHEPIPVSPRRPSVMHNVGAPVVIGPMNGGMTYPPAFQHLESRLSHAVWRVACKVTAVANWLIPGKRRAALLLVANERTRQALPANACPNVLQVVENGVNLKVWQDEPTTPAARGAGPTRFVFLGRLVDWKAVDVLIDAISRVAATRDVTLDVIGNGVERAALQAQAEQLGLSDRITFHGFVPQEQCPALLRGAILVLPSVHECGGAVVLEAMAMGLPVVATAWGGPLDYITEETGILVEPTSREALVAGFAQAMNQLAASPELQARLGAAGRRRVEQHFDWQRKIDTMLELYLQVSEEADEPYDWQRAPAEAELVEAESVV